MEIVLPALLKVGQSKKFYRKYVREAAREMLKKAPSIQALNVLCGQRGAGADFAHDWYMPPLLTFISRPSAPTHRSPHSTPVRAARLHTASPRAAGLAPWQ